MMRTVKVIVAGQGDAGKTSLIRQYTKGRFSDTRNLTLGIDITTQKVMVSGEVAQLAIFDIEGLQGQRSSFYLGAQAALLVYDGMEPASFAALPEWIERYRKYCLDAPLLIVGNKCDLGQRVPPHWRAVLTRYVGAQAHGAVSAKTGEGVIWAFETIAGLAVQRATGSRPRVPEAVAWPQSPGAVAAL